MNLESEPVYLNFKNYLVNYPLVIEIRNRLKNNTTQFILCEITKGMLSTLYIKNWQIYKITYNLSVDY